MWTCPKCETNNDGQACLICGSAQPLGESPAVVAERSARLAAQAMLNKLWVWKIVICALMLAVSGTLAITSIFFGMFMTTCSLTLVIVAAQSNGKKNGFDITIISIAGMFIFANLLILCYSVIINFLIDTGMADLAGFNLIVSPAILLIACLTFAFSAILLFFSIKSIGIRNKVRSGRADR